MTEVTEQLMTKQYSGTPVTYTSTSLRSVGRFLKGGRSYHQVRYWERPPDLDKEAFYQQSEKVWPLRSV